MTVFLLYNRFGSGDQVVQVFDDLGKAKAGARRYAEQWLRINTTGMWRQASVPDRLELALGAGERAGLLTIREFEVQ